MNCCDEYCANHGCNQGRDCPVRQGAKVAKIKRRTPDKQALPTTIWRAYVRHLAKWMMVVLAMLMATSIVSAVVSYA